MKVKDMDGLKIIAAAALLFFAMTAGGCSDAMSALAMKKYIPRSERKREEAEKKNAALELDKLKPRFMFEDDEKYFKSTMTLKEEFFLLDRSSYIGSQAISNFELEPDGGFIVYDKSAGALLRFNRFGTLTERTRLNFGAESRALAPTNMLRDRSGNVMMACGVLGRFYRFSPAGALLASNDIAEENAPDKKLAFATKVFETPDYLVYADIHSGRVYFYRGAKKAFEFSCPQMTDDAYVYHSQRGDYFLVDPPNGSIIRITPAAERDPGAAQKFALSKLPGNKILSASDGTLFVMRKAARVIDKYNPKGELVYQYGARPDANVAVAGSLCPADFALDGEDSLYILDDKNFKVSVYNRSGVFAFSFGSFGKRAGRFQAPSRIVVDRLKRIMVSDAERNEIIVFSGGGEYFESYGDILGTNALSHYGLYADLHEKIHILDFTGNQHYAVPYEFQFLKALNEMLNAKNNFPHNYITIDRLANLSFFDFNGQRNIELTPLAHMRALKVPEEINTQKTMPKKLFVKRLAADGYGNILALSRDEAFVYKLNIFGRILGRLKTPSPGQAYSVMDSDIFHNFYLAEKNERRITKFDQEGRKLVTFEADSQVSPRLKGLDSLSVSKKNLAFVTDAESGRTLLLSTADGRLSLDSVFDHNPEGESPLTVLDTRATDDGLVVLGSRGGNLIMLKYRATDYYRDAVHLYSQGLYQEALVTFERYMRSARNNPNALYYAAQCHRKLGHNYEAAMTETDLVKGFPGSLAAKKVK